MEEVCAQQAKEAAEKEAQLGTSTARTKWSQGEIEKFKAALARYGPDSTIKFAAEIGTRSAAQVNMFKCRFLKAYPSWLNDNYHPASPVANTPSSHCSSSSPRSLSSQTPEESSDHPPPRPSVSQAHRTTGARARFVAAKVPPRSTQALSPATTFTHISCSTVWA